jgi:hypothetical protein
MKPRKRYKPRGVNPLAHLVAIQGAAMLTLDDRIRWAMQIEDAINAVQTAQAETGHWTAIFDAVNLVEQLVLDGFAKDTDGIVNAAQEAVVAIMDRRISTGVKAARASELKALRTLAGAWSDLMDNITHQQRFASEERLYHRLRKAMHTKDSGARFFTP